MNRMQLYQAIGQADDDFLEQSEDRKQRKHHTLRWPTAVAALLVIAFVGRLVWHTQSEMPIHPESLRPEQIAQAVHTVAQPQYPEMVQYPKENAPDYEVQYRAWEKSRQAQKQEPGYADGMESFLTSTSAEFLSDSTGKNIFYSPLSIYLTLGMLTETTNGQSREQILDLLGVESIESLRKQAQAIWNAHYCMDGTVTSTLASSMWMNAELDFKTETIQNLANIYYASAHQGKMGTPEMDAALHAWLNEQTDGLLDEQIREIKTDPNTVLALASTIYFRAKWEEEFDPEMTHPDIFYSKKGKVSCNFLHSDGMRSYYETEHFSAVGLELANDAGKMWLLLPNKENTVEDLLQDARTMEFLLNGGDQEAYQYLMVHLDLPKFDITSQLDLKYGLKALRVQDVFDPEKADFSPLLQEQQVAWVEKVQHDARVAIDEEGIQAAAYTVMPKDGAASLSGEVDFVLDRTFLFAVTSEDNLPLFMGRVEQPMA